MMESMLEAIHRSGVISIIRGIRPESLKNTLDALYDGGVRCVEIALNTEGALSMIEQTKEMYGNRMLVGAGTAIDDISTKNAISAGADFVLSPTLSRSMIEICNLYSKLAVPGVFTATEVLEAKKAGAMLIKIFPVSSVGPAYIKELLGPLPDVKLLPVGGITEKNASQFIAAGAFAVGVGSGLVNKELVERGDFETIKEHARTIVDRVKNKD
jgi:2-dehydro-3-deoxyphosphogluconate aldolase / (4S)-4-hydroxy-2-oxoglutarate aldolase